MLGESSGARSRCEHKHSNACHATANVSLSLTHTRTRTGAEAHAHTHTRTPDANSKQIQPESCCSRGKVCMDHQNLEMGGNPHQQSPFQSLVGLKTTASHLACKEYLPSSPRQMSPANPFGESKAGASSSASFVAPWQSGALCSRRAPEEGRLQKVPPLSQPAPNKVRVPPQRPNVDLGVLNQSNQTGGCSPATVMNPQ